MKDFKTPKSKETYHRVLDSAMRLFEEKGYEKTTMRAISKEAELGLGALYYYFPSKEAIVTTFYEQLQQELNEEWSLEFEGTKDRELGEQLAAFLRLKFAKLEPYRPLLTVLLKEAVDPNSAVSPFSSQSHKALDQSLAIFQQMLGPNEYREKMANALWLGHLALIALWVHRPEKTSKAIDAFSELAPFLSYAAASGPVGEIVEDLLS